MFSKGSRYRNLPESTPVNAGGERLRSKEVRIIPPTPGQFQHTVHEGDRLDLLAFKYYGDATKWWQISDANPETVFPLDLLERQPISAERLVLTPQNFNQRFMDLLLALNGWGAVKHTVQDFLESTVALVYNPLNPLATSRRNILLAIQNHGFHFLRAFAWPFEANTAEAFTFDDVTVRTNWQKLMDDLAAMPGVLQVQSFVTEAVLHLVYFDDVEKTHRRQILAQIDRRGFALMPESSTLTRLGARFIVPPNQIA